MHTQEIEHWEHEHVFLGRDHEGHARRIQVVIGLTLAMMLGEVVAGYLWGSMALLADGWHMATHAGALSISGVAYAVARRRAQDPRFVFGTGKIGDLAGFTSAVVLAGVALWIGFESFLRFLAPVPIRFDQSLLVAVLGLVVNAACALLLGGGRARRAGEHVHRDHNLRSAYVHVAADALTSLLAIGALVAGRFLGWIWIDAVCGIAGSVVILRWSARLLQDTGAVLLDLETAPELSAEIRERVERGTDDRIADLHVWRLGPGQFAAIVSIVADEPHEPEHYKRRLRAIDGLAHLTVEVQPCVHAAG